MATPHGTPPGDTWHTNSLSGFPQGGIRHSQTHYPDDPLSCPDMLSGLSVSNLIESLGREMGAILVYTARSTFDGTILSHFKQLVTAHIPSPAERKDRNDGKSFPPMISEAACRAMMALPLPQRNHCKPKSLPTIKGDRASDTIKEPSCEERR